jgi:hypothetical protein
MIETHGPDNLPVTLITVLPDRRIVPFDPEIDGDFAVIDFLSDDWMDNHDHAKQAIRSAGADRPIFLMAPRGLYDGRYPPLPDADLFYRLTELFLVHLEPTVGVALPLYPTSHDTSPPEEYARVVRGLSACPMQALPVFSPSPQGTEHDRAWLQAVDDLGIDDILYIPSPERTPEQEEQTQALLNEINTW